MRVVKVRGDSMLPSYRNGDFLLVGRYRFRKPKMGDDIVFHHANLGSLVKRIDAIDAGRIRVKGLNPLSTEPAGLGTLAASDSQSLERVLLRIPSA